MNRKKLIVFIFALFMSIPFTYGQGGIWRQGGIWSNPYHEGTISRSFPETKQGTNLFDFKNKNIIIPPYKNGQQIDNVYQVKALKRNDFCEKYKVNVDIYGKEVLVKDVLFFDTQGMDRAICLLVTYKNNQYVLHFPLFKLHNYDYSITPYEARLYLKYDGYFGHLETTRVEDENNIQETIILFDPNSLRMLVYNVDEIKHLDDSLKGKTVFFCFDDKGYRPEGYEKLLQRPWKYEGIILPWEINGFNYNANWSLYEQAPIYYKFTNNGECFYYDMNYDGIFMFENDYINQCEKRFHDYYIDECNEKFSHQLIYINSPKKSFVCYTMDANNNTHKLLEESGVYYCDTIVLAYTDSKDSSYYSYHVILNRVGDDNKRIEPDIYFQIDRFKQNEVELDSVFRKNQRDKELERQQTELKRIQEEEKEEIEYHKMLVRKYGKTNAKLIENGEVRIGFTKQMCIESWGEPEYINTTTTESGKFEQWVYGWFSYLYFEGNKLVAIQGQE